MRCARLLMVTTREPGTGSICSSSSPVRAKCPRWLVPSCSSNPSTVVCFGGNITPALLTSRSILGCRARSSAAAARTDSKQVRSRGWTVTSAPGAAPAMRAAAALPLSVSRTASTTDAPRAARTRAVSNPRPVFAPVTTASRPRWPGTSSLVHFAFMIPPGPVANYDVRLSTIINEVDTCKNKPYRGFHEALRAGMRHRPSPGHRRRPVEPPPGPGADPGPAPVPRPRHRPAGHPQQRPGRTAEGPAGRRRHHPAHPPGTDRRDRVRADRRRPGAAARTERAAALGPALRTRTVPARRGPARLGTAGRRGPPDRPARRADLRAPGRAGGLLPRLRRRHAHRPPRAGTGRRRRGHHARRRPLQPPDRPDDRDRRRPAQHRQRRARDRPPRPGAARRSPSQAGTVTCLPTTRHPGEPVMSDIRSRTARAAAPGGVAAAGGPRPGLALLVLATAQLMVVLDATIVNVALPHIQRALGFSGSGLEWVVNAYALTFGGLLLLGGRAGDLLGRRKMFIAGLLVFSAASLVGGFATSQAWLLAARAVQGAGGALVAPTALALITTNFPQGGERNRAFSVYAAMAGAGSAMGLLLGGILTTYASWRWVMFVNVPIGIVVAAAAPRVLSESPRRPGRIDVAGAVTGTGGVALLVYGLSKAADRKSVV